MQLRYPYLGPYYPKTLVCHGTQLAAAGGMHSFEIQIFTKLCMIEEVLQLAK
jgi:hypothetical protein